MEISLWFVGAEPGVLLDRTEVLGPRTLHPIVSVRSVTAPNRAQGAFRWSAAVKALSLLLIEHRITGAATLSGERGSAAASLDYALTKRPNWLMDMFGTTRSGETHLHYFIYRRNSEQKLPGPVEIGVLAAKLLPERISIYLNGVLLDDLHSLRILADDLRSQTRSKQPLVAGRRQRRLSAPIQPDAIEEESKAFRKMLERSYAREVHRMLWATDVFTARGIRHSVQRLVNDPTCRRILGSSKRRLSELGTFVPLGVKEEVHSLISIVNAGRPLRVCVERGQAPAICIMRHLQRQYRVAIEVDMNVNHSVELVRRLGTYSYLHPPDICFLTVMAASTQLAHFGKREYVPVSFMPKISHRVVSNAGELPLRDITGARGELRFMTEVPGSATFYYNNLRSAGVLGRAMKTVHAEPDEITSLFAAGAESTQAIMAFPFYDINSFRRVCRVAEEYPDCYGEIETMLFMRRSLVRNKRRADALLALIGHAWLHLRENPGLIQQAASSLLDDPDYRAVLCRAGGLVHLERAKGDTLQ
ncbi:MAG: hypothetical protein KDD69_01970 [Bdellovibrionales bacterium]|nr:hypothetical protein [Bdellovibrionales bacterium]